MKRTILLGVTLLSCLVSIGQNVFISGSGKNIAGKTIKLYSVADAISGLQKEEQILKLSDEDSTFSFAITLPEEKVVMLKIDLMRYSFVARPGTKYALKVQDFEFTAEDSLYAYSFGLTLPCELTMERYDGINQPIQEVDNALNEFLLDSQRLLFVKDKETINNLYALRDSLITKYQGNDYMQNYITYEFAGIDFALSLKSRKSIKDSLFAHKPILYSNLAYMNCFQNVFSKYFSKGYKFIKRSDIEQWLATNNYNAFNDALGRDNVLENEVFRELVFLQGMKDSYLDGYFDRNLVKNMLGKFAASTKFSQHKTIAENIIQSLGEINAENHDIRDLKVKDIDNETKTLAQYINDKPLIVCFIRLEQEISLKELEGIHFCYDSIKDNCDVLTICCSNNFERMYNFIKNNKVGNKYKWNFVYFDENYDLMESFHIRTFPTFVLVSPQGKIIRNPMDSPSLGSFMEFKKIKTNQQQ